MSVDSVGRNPSVKPTDASSLMTVAGNLIAKHNELLQVGEELMAQMHNQTLMLKEALVLLNTLRLYGKRGRS